VQRGRFLEPGEYVALLLEQRQHNRHGAGHHQGTSQGAGIGKKDHAHQSQQQYQHADKGHFFGCLYCLLVLPREVGDVIFKKTFRYPVLLVVRHKNK
jgi:hypothetical protein